MASPRDARFKTLKSSEFVYVEGGGGLLWGGYFDNNEFNTETYLYLPSRNSWRKLTTLGTPQGRMAHCMVAGSSRVVAVYGGIGPAADRQRLTHFDGLWLLDLNALPRDLP
jgi:N-acetylneuraminic acid mutarotase